MKTTRQAKILELIQKKMWKHRKNCPHISKKKGFRLPRQPYPVISVN